ncbi:MAG TPA: hypothetical protein PLJ47_05555 [Candidatus Hydrogenedentes bacterium]|nr:hypothetical protein [Candidatus Hydrogenedentota bacterium]
MTDSQSSGTTSDQLARWPVVAGIFVVAAATLLMEVALTRIFSYTIWYHFAFITIAVALMGFGASGSIASLWPGFVTRGRAVLAWTALMSALGVFIVLYTASRSTFDPMWIVQHPIEIVRFAICVIAVTVPFFFAGLTVSLILARYPRQSGLLYGADLAGAALGCALLPLLLPPLEGAGVLTACAALFILGSLLLAPFPSRVYYGVLAVVVFASLFQPWNLEFTPSKSKQYRMLVSSREHQVVYDRWTSVFRTEVAKFPVPRTSRGISYGSWGLSEKFDGTLPYCTFILHDGGAAATIHTFESDEDIEKFYTTHMLGLPYRFKPGARVCIGGVGGGVDVVSALTNGAQSVLGIELDPSTAHVITGPLSHLTNDRLVDPRVKIEVGDARSVIRRSNEKFDVINLTAVDTITAVAAGAHLLSESYLYTVDAVTDFFDHLAPNGILCLATSDTSGHFGPPRMIPRLAATIAEALSARGVENPSSHVLVVVDDKKDTLFVSILAKAEPFTAEEFAQYDAYVHDNGFKYWHDGRSPGEVTTSRILAANEAERAEVLRNEKMLLHAVTDDQPFFFSFYRWRDLFENPLVSGAVEVSYLGPTGDIVLLLALATTLTLSILIIVIPSSIARRRAKTSRLAVPDLLFFCAIGLGFMMFEIPLMQRLVLFLGYPTYSLSVVLFSLLLATGAGSFLTRNIGPTSNKTLWIGFACLLAISLFNLLFGDALLLRLLHLPLAARIAITVITILPLGILLGIYFPLGIRALGNRNPAWVPLAWAANGTCSVVGIFIALILAMNIGFRWTFLCALALYAIATLSFHTAVRIANQR